MKDTEKKIEKLKDNLLQLLNIPTVVKITTDYIITEKGFYIIHSDKPINIYINPHVKYIEQIVIFAPLESKGFNLITKQSQEIWGVGVNFKGTFTIPSDYNAAIKLFYFKNVINIIDLKAPVYYINDQRHEIRANYFEFMPFNADSLIE